MKKLFVCLLALLLVAVSVLPVLAADGSVIYSGNAREFIFEPGSEYSPTDLFPNYKDVMPGDSLTQRITVRNERRKTIIRVYMRALGAHEDSEEFLSQLHLRVNKISGSELFDAPADETAQLTDWVWLCTLQTGGEAELEVILDVPVELDNRFSNAIGYLDWEFMVEEYPTGGGSGEIVLPDAPELPPEEEEEETLPPEEILPDTPHTGERNEIGFWTAVLLCSAVLLLITLLLLLLRRRKKDEEQNPEEEQS